MFWQLVISVEHEYKHPLSSIIMSLIQEATPAVSAPQPIPAVTNPDPSKKKNNRRGGKQRDPGAYPLKREAPKIDPTALKPKHVSTSFTAEKNDPLISNTEALYDGGMGLPSSGKFWSSTWTLRAM